MPWVKAGDITPAYKETRTIAVAGVTANFIAYRFQGLGGFDPLPFGYLTCWSTTNLPDATAIALGRHSYACWSPAGMRPIVPAGGNVIINRIGFHRLWPREGVSTVSLYYFTP